MPFEYVLSVNRYRDTDTGRFVSRKRVLGHVDSLIDLGDNAGAVLAAQVSAGTISPADYGELMRREIKDTYIQQAILGRGGRNQMTPSDWGALGNPLKVQYAYLDGFVAQMEERAAAGNPMSEAEIRNRGRLYFQTARQAYERANAAAYGLPVLPAYPGDLTTECMSGCRCYWRIIKLENPGDFNCFWELEIDGESCGDCIQRGNDWYPLAVRNGTVIDDGMRRALGIISAGPDMFYSQPRAGGKTTMHKAFSRLERAGFIDRYWDLTPAGRALLDSLSHYGVQLF